LRRLGPCLVGVFWRRDLKLIQRLRALFLANVVLVAVLLTGPAFSQQSAPARAANQATGHLKLNVDPAKSSVHYTVDSTVHTVHGTFQVKRGAISLEPSTGKVSGEIVVDATSGQSGNDSRDRKMHSEVIESARFSEIIFRPDKVDGSVSVTGNSSVKLHGTFVLHGAEHDFEAPTQAQMSGNQWKASTAFRIPYVEWKLKNPSNFLLKVKPYVDIEVELAGTVDGGS
jgi:hypothetical protein